MQKQVTDELKREAYAVHERATQLSTLLRHVKQTRVPALLLKSKCPRLCIPLSFSSQAAQDTSQSAGTVRTWASAYSAATSSTLRSVESARIALAVCLLLSKCGAARVGSTSTSLNSPYVWLYGDAARPERAAAQRSALVALGKNEANVRSNVERIESPALFYVDSEQRLWAFFVDGRVNFADCVRSAAKFVVDAPNASHPMIVECSRRFLESPAKLIMDCGALSGDELSVDSADGRLRANPADVMLQLLTNKFTPSAEYCELRSRDTTSYVSLCVPTAQAHVLAEWPVPSELARYCTHELRAIDGSERPGGVRISNPLIEGVRELATAFVEGQNLSRDANGNVLDCDSRDDYVSEEATAQTDTPKTSSDEPNDEFRIGAGQRVQRVKSVKLANGTLRTRIDSVFSQEASVALLEQAMESMLATGDQSASGLDEAPYKLNDDEPGYGQSLLRPLSSDEAGNELDVSFSEALGELTGSTGDKSADKKGSKSMLQGAAMLEEFMKRSIFQRFRVENERETRRVRNTHAQGTDDFRESLGDLKRAQLTRFVHAFFTSPVVPDCIEQLRTWWTDPTKCRQQVPEMLLVNETVGPFENFMMRRYMDIDKAFSPGRQMEATLLCHIASPAGFCHEMKMRPAVLLLGPPSTGKSYVLLVAKSLMPPGTATEMSYRTEKAGLTNTDETDRVVVMQEVPHWMLGVDKHGNPESVDGHVKDMFTNSIRTVHYMDHRKDPETGEAIREDKTAAKRYEVCFLGASNDPVAGREDALIKRFVSLTLHASSEEDTRIVTMMNKPEWSNSGANNKNVVESWQAFYSLVAFVEKAIESNAILDVNMDAMSEMKHLLEFVQYTYGMYTDDPKSYDKMSAICRLLTVQYAVYVALCSELGVEFRECPGSDVPRRLDLEPEMAVRALLAVEKHLVCTRSIVVFVFSLLRTEWIDEMQQKIFQALRYIYLSSDEKIPVGINKRTPLFRSARNSRLNTDLTIATASLRDMSYLVVDADGSTSYHAIASMIANAIPDQRIPPDDISRVLRRMSKTRISTPIFTSSADGHVPGSMPQMLVDPKTKHIFKQNMNMIVMQSYEDEPPSSVADGFTVLMNNPKEARSKSFCPTSADASESNASTRRRFSERTETRTTDRMWCGILYELVRTPNGSRVIVESAIDSLSHIKQIGQTQTFCTSLPIERFISNSVLDQAKTVGFTALPSLYTMKISNRLRAINNPQPLLPHMDLYSTMFRRGPRADDARRTCPIHSASSAMMIVDVDPDMTALISHHERIGCVPNVELHASRLLATMLPLRAKLLPNIGFIDYKGAVDDIEISWVARRATEQIMRTMYESESDALAAFEEVKPAMGLMSHTISSARQLTDMELATNCTRKSVQVEQIRRGNELLSSVRKDINYNHRSLPLDRAVSAAKLTSTSSSDIGACGANDGEIDFMPSKLSLHVNNSSTSAAQDIESTHVYIESSTVRNNTLIAYIEKKAPRKRPAGSSTHLITHKRAAGDRTSTNASASEDHGSELGASDGADKIFSAVEKSKSMSAKKKLTSTDIFFTDPSISSAASEMDMFDA